jgi:peptidoglycan/xylan/chitin deacetylase (PgdA/CDA1 family)
LLLQFDDGLREVYDVVAPILWEKGVTATFFLVGGLLDNKELAYSNKVSIILEHLGQVGMKSHSEQLLNILGDWGYRGTNIRKALLSLDHTKKDAVDAIANVVGCDFTAYLLKVQPYLTSEQVCKLIGMGFTIGAHSMDHSRYSLIPLQEQLYQTRTSIHYVRERFSLDYGAFAFPNGDDNVSDHFFRIIFADGNVDVSFGNIGKRRDVHPRHFPRLSIENASAVAERVIGRYYAAALYDLAVTRRFGRIKFVSGA